MQDLSLRERFQRTMAFEAVPLIPNFEFGYWERTLERWRGEGLPAHITDEASAYDYFGIESPRMVAVTPTPLPKFEEAVLEETETHKVYRDGFGCIARINKEGDRSIPHFIEFPVKDRASWESYKHALDPDDPARWVYFEQSLAEIEAADDGRPAGVDAGSLMGHARNLMGFEAYATLPYEDPGLFRDMTYTFGHGVVTVLERVLARIRPDFAHGWEDICFNLGPIIPPAIIRETVGPWYRRIADLLAAHGCTVYSTDTDGNILPIIDIFLDNGLNTMFPVEVHAGSDPLRIRARHGKRVRLWGGVDKMKLAAGRAEIDAMLESLRPLVDQGGFIPTVDHRVPATVSLDNYKHYLDRKRALLRAGGVPKY
jgi:uroporphyrinogen decarboxylase